MKINPEEVAQPSSSDICKGCKKEIERGATRCHHCGEYQAFWRDSLTYLPLIVSLITIIILFGQLYISRQQLTETKAKRIEAERVLKLAKDALKKADSVLANANTKVDQLNLKVQKADENLNTFTKRQNNLSKDVKNIKIELTAEVKKLRDRNEIISLADTAIAKGKTASYEELYRKFNKLERDSELYHTTMSSILKVKNFYRETTRVKKVEIYSIKPDGTKLTNNELPTKQLIKFLLEDSNWHWRTKAAEILRTRKEKGVPDTLIQGMKDKQLDVRRMCIVSFEFLTKFANVDVLEYDELIKWWKEHKKEWESKLPK